VSHHQLTIKEPITGLRATLGETMQSKRKIDIDSIDQLIGEGPAWEVEGVDATFLGKVAVIVIVAVIVL